MNSVPRVYTKTKEAHIVVENLTMAYGDFVLMRDLSYTINRGDVFIIMGGSGCGKSTMMMVLIGLKSPAKGKVFYGGEDFWGADADTRDRIIRRAGVMYQSGALWSSLNLAENVALPLEQFTKFNKAQIRSIVSFKLSLVGLSGFENFYPSEISGGMAKRAGVARALALDPEVLYLDEPSAGLDPLSARRMDELILELSESLGMTIVVVTHELDSIFMIADNAVFLDAKSRTQKAVGNPRELRDNCENEHIRNFLTRGEHLSGK